MAILKYLRVGDTAELQDNGVRWIRIPSQVAVGKQSGVIYESEDGTPVYTWWTDAHVMMYKVTEPANEDDGSTVSAASDPQLAAIAGLTPAADKFIVWDTSTTATMQTCTTAAQGLLDDADVSTMRTTLGLVIGTNVQTESALLTSYAAQTYASGSYTAITGASTAAIRTYAQVLSDIGAQPTHGLLTSFAAQTYASGSYASITGASTVAIKTYAETLATLSGVSAASFDFNTEDVTGVGAFDATGVVVNSDLTLATGSITSASDAITFGNEALSTTGTLASGALTVTGAGAISSTLSVGSTLTASGDVFLSADNLELQFGDAAADSYIYFDGTDLTFYDTNSGSKTLSQLASQILNPTVGTGEDFTISEGAFNWTNTADEVAGTWAFSNVTNDGIDIAMAALTTGNGIHVVADAVTTGKVLHIQADHSLAAGAHIYLDWLESGGNADGRYFVCYDGTGDVFTIKKDGAVEIAGNAEGTDAITITDGDITLTDGDVQVVAGFVQVDSATAGDQSHVKRNATGASTAAFHVENTHGTGTGYAQTIIQAATGAAGGLSISNKGSSPTLYLPAGGARTGGASYGIHVPVANQVAERLFFADGAYLGTIDQGAIEVASTGVLIAGGNLLRLSSTGNNAQNSFIAEIAVTSGTIAGATDGFCLQIDDDSVGSTSYAVNIDSASNEALKVTQGLVSFAENLTVVSGGYTVTGDSTIAGKLTITANDAANVDALVITHGDTASTSGILVTFASDGAGVRVTNEKVDGVCYEAICGVDATTENQMYLDGGAAARWIGADNAAILKIHTDSDFAHAGASCLHIDRAVGTNAASTQGSCLRIVDKSDAGSGFAVEIDSSGNVEALNVVAGTSTFAETVTFTANATIGTTLGVTGAATFTAGAQSAAVAVAADDPGVAIADGTSFVTATVTTNADDMLILPTPTPGNVVWIATGAAIGLELRSSDPNTVLINGGAGGAGVEMAIAAADVLTRCVCLDATHWIVTQFAANGTESAGDAAAV